MAAATFAIRLFGRFGVARGGKALACLEARKVQELFAYLLLYRKRSHFRETLADVLWGESAGPQSRKHLRQALWELQNGLEIDPASPDCLFVIDTEWVRFNTAANAWLDVAAFEEAWAAVQGVPGVELAPETAEALRGAAELYRGDLLEGCYQDWCLFERERLQNDYLAMLEKLMDCCEARGAYETALDYGARVLRLDRARERTHRRLMRLNYLAGDRIAAIRQYRQCAAALEEELGVRPSASTVHLCEQIKAETLSLPPRDRGSPQPTADAKNPRLSYLLQQFQSLQATLTSLQSDLAQQIDLVQLAAHTDE